MADYGDSLRIGDYITLKNVAIDSYLCTEGILQENIQVNDNLTQFDDYLFCVHLQRQYSAAKELDDFLKSNETIQKSTADEKNDQKVLKALRRGQDNESKLNDVYMRKRLGEDVKLGAIVQLYHVKSCKYLTVIPEKLAIAERENLRVGLHAHGSSFSWIQICPRFKIDKEGDPIMRNTEIYLKFAERSTEFIHCSQKDPISGFLREVNCSLESTSWRLNIFQSSRELKDRNVMLAYQVVYINDPETKSNLTIATRDLTSLEDTNDDEPQEFSHEFGDIVLEPTVPDSTNSRALWYVELKILVLGGSIRWKAEQVRFKHVNSGRYLLATTVPGEGEEMEERHVLSTTADPTDARTLFNMVDIAGTNKILNFDRPLQIRNGDIWLERGDVMDGQVYVMKGSLDNDKAVSFKVYKYSETPEETQEEGEEEDEQGANTKKKGEMVEIQPLDVYTGRVAREYLTQFYNMTAVPRSNSVGTIWQEATRFDIEFFDYFMEKITNFSQGFYISQEGINLAVDTCEDKHRIRRQNLLRDQGLLEVLLKLTSKLIPISNMVDDSPKLLKQSGNKISEEQQAMIQMGREVLEKCFQLMFWSIKDNPENQMYVADHMPVLLAHLGGQPLAGKCVTEMLANNVELQETKIGDREISIFVEKLRSSKMNAMYLQLLQACCSCQGDGVDSNQFTVVTLLFSNTNDIIINLHADYTKAQDGNWDETSLYIPFEPIPGCPMLGEDLVKKGLPRLSLAWTTNSIDFSPLGLFGKLSVDVEELYMVKAREPRRKAAIGNDDGVPISAMAKKLKAKKSASSEQKLAVANYFIAEVFLGAEMCMGRNYVSMNTLGFMFPYDVLVTLLKLNIDDRLQSAAARILLCMHIDRDPQAETKIPLLTRTWSEVVKSVGAEPKLPYVEPGRRHLYALVQQILHEHIIGMANCRWSELSGYMMQLLKWMVKFNFYGTTQRMQNVIGPLIKALDRRSLDVSSLENSMEAVDMSSSNVRVEGEDFTMDENGDAIPKPKWQKPVLEFMESLPVMLFVLAVVLAAVAVVVYQSLDSSATDAVGSPIFVFGILVLGFFCCEIGVRGYCALTVRDTPAQFFSNVFNQIDLFVIAIDVVFLALPSNIGSKGGNVKVLRLIRLIRLLRVLRAARVVNRIGKIMRATSLDSWVVPVRYSKCPAHEVATMVEAVEILAQAQSIIQDRNLTILLKYFYLWENGEDTRTPREIFEQIIADGEELSLGIEDFDYVFVDLLMFSSAPLVQSCLEILQAHHSTRRTLLHNAAQVQLLVSSKRERQYKIVDQMLQQLERNAETQELWGGCKSEADLLTLKQTKDIIKELTATCRIRRTVLEFDEDHMADTEIQNLFRNLNCFDIALKVVDLLDSDGFGENGNPTEATREIVTLCNKLLYWFFLGNPDNQEIGFDQLSMFMDTLDEGVGSHLVIRALFKGNEKLMRAIPHENIRTLTEKICKAEPEDRSPFDLSLMLAMTHVGDKGIKENQLEIVRQFTAPGRIAKLSSWFCSTSSPEYAEKVEMMKPYLDVKNISVEELPTSLAYHFRLVELLSGLTVGRLGGITTIEAKVQSSFNYTHVIEGILHPGTMLLGKIYFSQFLFNAVIEVEMMIPGLEQSAIMWELIQHLNECLTSAKDDFLVLHKAGLESRSVHRQRIEYHIVCIMVVGGFFGRYYDPATLRLEEAGSTNADKVKLSTLEMNELATSLYYKVKAVNDLHVRNLSPLQKSYITESMESLYKNATKIAGAGDQESGPTVGSPVKSSAEDMETAAESSLELKITQRYQEFLAVLEQDEKVQELANQENVDFISILEKIPFIIDDVVSDIRQEPLFRKLVNHVRENLTLVNGEKRLNARCTATTMWVVRGFRTMVENRMGMTIYERDDNGGEEQDIAAAPVIAALNACGATTLILELISAGIDPTLQLEAVKLGVALLFKEGGSLEVQKIMNNYLNSNDSELFFKQLHLTVTKLIEWHKWNDIVELVDGAEPELPDDIIFLRFIQLMSEGHFRPNQDIMREQPNNTKTFNLLDDFVNYLSTLARIRCRTSSVASCHVASVILEVIQGPCMGNQVHFCLKTDLLEILNRILRYKPVLDCVPEEETSLKLSAIDIFQGLLEGQLLTSVVYERTLSVIHMDIIMQLAGAKNTDEEEEEDEDEAVKSAGAPKVLSEDEEVLQVESLVLLQMLCDSKPSLRGELGLAGSVEEFVGGTTGCIEIMWNKTLLRRFFHIPSICEDMAKSSMDLLVEHVDRSNYENQLINFVERSHDIYREVKHQQVLKELGISAIFSKTNHDRATWGTFILTWVINILYLNYYTAGRVTMSDGFGQNSTVVDMTPMYTTCKYAFTGDWPAGDAPHMAGSHGVRAHAYDCTYADTAGVVISVLNYLQMLIALFTLILSLVVRSPVQYQALQSKGFSFYDCVYYTATEPMTVYYVGYLLLSLLGICVADYFITILLLDIVVKNSTTRQVLNAVANPWYNIAMAGLLGAFIIYIFSFFMFFYYPNVSAQADDSVNNVVCKDLFSCFLTGLYYIQSGGGQGDFITYDVGYREIMDIFYFLFIMVIMLNVIFGIVIDTFSDLRAKRDQRIEKTENFCFICGIEKQEFDRAADGADGFKTHIKFDHNMWNYMKFIFFIWEQDQDDDDGLEQFVRRCVSSGDTTWFPMQKAICLDSLETEEEKIHKEFKEVILNTKEEVGHSIESLQASVDSTLKQLLQSIMSAQPDDEVVSVAEQQRQAREVKGDGGPDRRGDNDSLESGSQEDLSDED